MKNPVLPLSVVMSASIALGAACSSTPGAPPGSDSQDGSVATGGIGASAGTGGTQTTSPNNPDNEIDLGELPVGSTGGGPSNAIQNGGTEALSPEQIASIKDGECSGVTSTAQAIPSIIELVVDISQSMGVPAPGQPMMGGSTRWDLAMPALIAAIDSLPDATAVGLQLFPTSNAPGLGVPGGPTSAECVGESGHVPIAPLGPAGSMQRAALTTALETTALYFGTPTHDGYHNALENGLRAYDGPGDRFMLLMTDGAPTQEIGCGPSLNEGSPVQPILDEVAAVAAEGIRTFVIGSPGSEDAEPTGADMRPFLSEVAQVGGTGPDGCSAAGPAYCHFDMTQAPDFAAALTEGLAAIADQVAGSCVFQAPDEGNIDLSTASVVVEWGDGSADLVMRDDDADCSSEGWKWNAAGEIELCPATCAKVETTAGSTVSVSLGCTELVR